MNGRKGFRKGDPTEEDRFGGNEIKSPYHNAQTSCGPA